MTLLQDLSCNRLRSLYIWPEGAALAALKEQQQNAADANRSANPRAHNPYVSALRGLPNLCVETRHFHPSVCILAR